MRKFLVAAAVLAVAACGDKGTKAPDSGAAMAPPAAGTMAGDSMKMKGDSMSMKGDSMKMKGDSMTMKGDSMKMKTPPVKKP